MKFLLRPILSEMRDLYSRPISPERFEEYLAKLEGGNKGELTLPISGFNPMAKEHILSKIDELEKLEAEKLMQKSIDEFNSALKKESSEEYLVVLNIADDLKGAWTNYYSTDFDSKFKLNGLIARKFCLPYFWASENYSPGLIKRRTFAYMLRTIYRVDNLKPKTLEEHLKQEIYVATQIGQSNGEAENLDPKAIETFYRENRKSVEYDKIFNFFYGDKGSESLGYKKYGIQGLTGYGYAEIIASRMKKSVEVKE